MKLESVIFLYRFFSSKKDERFPIGVTYKMTKFLKTAEEDINFFNEEYSKILKKYNVKDNLVPQEELDNFNKDLNDLISIEVTTTYPKFSLEDLSHFTFSLEETNLIYPFIQE